MAKIRTLLKQNKSGFTLAETLAAILILLMVTGIAAVGIPVAADAYAKIITTANAQVLISTTMTCLRDELGTATEVRLGTVDSDWATAKTIYFTGDTGRKVKIYNSSAGIMVEEIQEGEAAVVPARLLVSNSAANKNLHVVYGNVTYSGGILKFTDITVKKGETSVADIEMFEVNVLTAVS